MTVREWLNRNYKLAKELETKSACLETLINITSKTDRDFFVGHSDNSQELKFIRWSELKEEVEKLAKEVREVDKVTDSVLRTLEDPDEYRVLYCRFVCTWSGETSKRHSVIRRLQCFDSIPRG